MSVKIGSNISSLQAQRRLGEASSVLSKTYEKLSSGQRINRASDDAAGLAISLTLNANTKIFTQGIRNLNDGISYTTIAGGALKELKSILYRKRELATQASNGTYSDHQRKALEAELKELSAEWNRVLDSTEFNGRKVFQAGEDVTLQAGVGSEAVLSAAFGSNEALAQDDLSRGSETAAGVGGDGDSPIDPPAISADGRFLAFNSYASNLVAGDTNDGICDVYVKDLQNGRIIKVSGSSSGGAADGDSRGPSISADGRYVTFISSASNLIAGDTADGFNDVFVKDLQTGELRKVTTATDGGAADGLSSQASISADGRYVSFASMATNLMAGDSAEALSDIYVKDLISGNIVKVTQSTSGGAANHHSYASVLSAAGDVVAYWSYASNLVSSDTNGNNHNIFVTDLRTNQTTIVSTSASGTQASGWKPSISADGRYVAFESTALNLVPGKTTLGYDIFVKDRVTGEITRESVTSSGEESNDWCLDPSISGDGNYVSFHSAASNLVTGDSNWVSDTFVKDRRTGEIRRLSVDAQGIEGDSGSSAAVISSNGRYVVFASNEDHLVANDSENHADLFSVGNPFATWSSVSRSQWLSVATRQEAMLAQSRIDSYFTELNSVEGLLGAIEARIGAAVNNIHSMKENCSVAQSRILDCDVGQETAEVTRRQIVQQAAAAVLAQANLQPQIALQLLRA